MRQSLRERSDRSCKSRLCFESWGFIKINGAATSRSGQHRGFHTDSDGWGYWARYFESQAIQRRSTSRECTGSLGLWPRYRIRDELRRDAVIDQRVIKLERLRDGHAVVAGVGENQRRRLDLDGVVMGDCSRYASSVWHRCRANRRTRYRGGRWRRRSRTDPASR